MARKTPVQLHRIALDLHRRGHGPETIADMLGLHPGALRNWLDTAREPCTPASATRLSVALDHPSSLASGG